MFTKHLLFPFFYMTVRFRRLGEKDTSRLKTPEINVFRRRAEYILLVPKIN